MEAPAGLKNYSLRCSLNSVFRLIQSMPKVMGILEIFAGKLSIVDNLLPNDYLTIGSFLLCGRDLFKKSHANINRIISLNPLWDAMTISLKDGSGRILDKNKCDSSVS